MEVQPHKQVPNIHSPDIRLLTASVLRVKDPQKSLEYYKLLGLSQINKIEQPDNKFDLYFLGQPLLRDTFFSA